MELSAAGIRNGQSSRVSCGINGAVTIIAILRQAEGGVTVAQLRREHGMMPLPGNGASAE
ncbi:hypothetical protein [Cypionkella sp. TWP1-2-1b2]|uniref:hypothetical protein n=1 Tax=Cypionkella sp. TWP1-2-1b2 TaxID=2804675 RepID=UPI003CF8D9A9